MPSGHQLSSDNTLHGSNIQAIDDEELEDSTDRRQQDHYIPSRKLGPSLLNSLKLVYPLTIVAGKRYIHFLSTTKLCSYSRYISNAQLPPPPNQPYYKLDTQIN